MSRELLGKQAKLSQELKGKRHTCIRIRS